MNKLKGYVFELGPIRPPSEGQDLSLLIRATKNCPWNRCRFCHTYKGKRFEYRSVEDIKRDIDTAGGLAHEIKAASWKLGYGGEVNGEVVRAVIQGNPEVYSGNDGEVGGRLECLANVANWLSSGARTAFLQDANTLIMRTPELVQVIKYLKNIFPSLERVTSYGRSKTAARKSLDELKELHRAGLSRLHIGLESGCDEVLVQMQKGVTAEEHIAGGRKVVCSGISLSEYVMPGLGGRKWSEPHALESARVLSEINPDYIRMRSLIVTRDSPLSAMVDSGEFQELTEDEVIDEIGLFVENLDCNSYLVSDHIANLLWEIEGKLPQDKGAMLDTISKYKTMLPAEKLKFRLKRRLDSHLRIWGKLDEEVRAKVEGAFQAIESEAPDAAERTDQAVLALRDSFI
jgi:hypothetical protein